MGREAICLVPEGLTAPVLKTGVRCQEGVELLSSKSDGGKTRYFWLEKL